MGACLKIPVIQDAAVHLDTLRGSPFPQILHHTFSYLYVLLIRKWIRVLLNEALHKHTQKIASVLILPLVMSFMIYILPIYPLLELFPFSVFSSDSQLHMTLQ